MYKKGIPEFSLISKQALKEFREIYKQEFSEVLSNEECIEKAITVLDLFRILTAHKLDLSENDSDD